jgi:hypothetical protein
MTKTIDTPELYKKATKVFLYNDLQRIAQEMIDSDKALVEFSIFKDMGGRDDEWKVKAPNIESTKPVIEGDVVFYSDYWRVTDYNEGEKVYSVVYNNPTWKDIINATNNMLLRTCRYGLFLEGLTQLETNADGPKMICIEFGS